MRLVKLLTNRLRLTCNRSRDHSTSQPGFALGQEEIDAYVKLVTEAFSGKKLENHETNKGNEESICSLITKLRETEDYLKSITNSHVENDKEMQSLFKEEEEHHRNEMKCIQNKLLLFARQDDPMGDQGAIVEVSGAVGGAEAKLFSEELFDMYVRYATFKKWNITSVECRTCEGGGIHVGNMVVTGQSVFKHLQHEAGIHRVQRVPITESGGRIHTSTCRVLVLPQLEENDIQINESDLHIVCKHSSGPGGQNVNKTESCVRIKHIPTGVTVEDQTTRHQSQNKTKALEKLKNILSRLELEKKLEQVTTVRKEKVGSADRSDKIRTYNFPKSRVTDHRLHYTVSNVVGFMEGKHILDEVISQLIQKADSENLVSHVRKILKDQNVQHLFNRQKS